MIKRVLISVAFLISFFLVGATNSLIFAAESAGGMVSNEAVVGFYNEDKKPDPTPHSKPAEKPRLNSLPQTGEKNNNWMGSLGLLVLIVVGVFITRMRYKEASDEN